MAQTLIRNLEQELLDDYRRAARSNGRSLEAELRMALERMRPRQPKSKEELIALSRRLRAMTPPGPQTPSEDIIRAHRDGFRDS
jgi:plasmid stability protein